MSYYVYFIKSTNESTYIGATVDLDKRIRQHNKEIKGGATGLPARWYNNDAVGNRAEHSSNVLADKYGTYKPASLGPDTNLYPYSCLNMVRLNSSF